MTFADLLQELGSRHITLSLDFDGSMIYEAPPGAITPDLLERIRPHKKHLLEYLSNPRTLTDFAALGYYPAVYRGELRLLTAAGSAVIPPHVFRCWQGVRDTLQGELEARQYTLLTWAERLLADLGEVELRTPDTATAERETHLLIDDPAALAGEVLRCEALGVYFDVTALGVRYDPPTPWGGN